MQRGVTIGAIAIGLVLSMYFWKVQAAPGPERNAWEYALLSEFTVGETDSWNFATSGKPVTGKTLAELCNKLSPDTPASEDGSLPRAFNLLGTNGWGLVWIDKWKTSRLETTTYYFKRSR